VTRIAAITDDSGVTVVDWSDGSRTRIVTASQVYVPMHGDGRLRYAHGLAVGMTRAKAEAALRRAVRAHVRARDVRPEHEQRCDTRPDHGWKWRCSAHVCESDRARDWQLRRYDLRTYAAR
jgi:hypothetical protein